MSEAIKRSKDMIGKKVEIESSSKPIGTIIDFDDSDTLLPYYVKWYYPEKPLETWALGKMSMIYY